MTINIRLKTDGTKAKLKSLFAHWTMRQISIYVIVAALVFAIVIWAGYFDHEKPKDIAGLVLPLVGTFVGAAFAFRLEQTREVRRIEDERVAAINQTMIALFAQFNELYLINEDLKEHTGWSRVINLRPRAFPDSFEHRLIPEKLAFLVEFPEIDTNLLMEITVEQRRFDTCIFALKDRNTLMIDTIQPLIAKLNLNHEYLLEEQFQAAIGEWAFSKLKSATDNVYDNIPPSLKSIRELMDHLFDAFKTLYPHRRTIKFGALNIDPTESNENHRMPYLGLFSHPLYSSILQRSGHIR